MIHLLLHSFMERSVKHKCSYLNLFHFIFIISNLFTNLIVSILVRKFLVIIKSEKLSLVCCTISKWTQQQAFQTSVSIINQFEWFSIVNNSWVWIFSCLNKGAICFVRIINRALAKFKTYSDIYERTSKIFHHSKLVRS